MPRSGHPRSVSVVLAVRDKAQELPAQLEALASQDAEVPWELVIADNGSTDGSLEIAERALAGMPDAKLIRVERPGASRARNAGAAAARGELLLFTDADDLVQPGWLAGMWAAAGGGDVIAGGLGTGLLNPDSARAWHVRMPRERALAHFPFLSYASGTNTGIWAHAFRALGGYDEQIAVGEDIELSWRAQVAGYTLVHAPEAVVEYRLRTTVAALARQHWSYGQAGPHLYRRFRAHGMGRPPLAASARGWLRVALGWPAALVSGRQRGRWALEASSRAGQLAACVQERVVFL